MDDGSGSAARPLNHSRCFFWDVDLGRGKSRQESDPGGPSRHWKEMFSAKTLPCTHRRENITRCPGSRIILRLSRSVKRNGTFEPSAALMIPCPIGSTLLMIPFKLLPSSFWTLGAPAYCSSSRGGGTKAANCLRLTVVNAEYGQQPGQLQHVVELGAQIRQVQRRSLMLCTDVRRHQHP